MTRFEEDFFHSLPLIASEIASEIAKQLKIMNKLKCFEIKAKHPDLTEAVDSIEDQVEN